MPSAASPSQPLLTKSMPKMTALATASKVSLDSCSPQALAEALIAVRGKEEALRILQEATKIASSQEETKVVSPDEKPRSNNNDKNKELLGKHLLSEPIETSFLSPRMGKFSLQLYENGLKATKTNDPTVQLTLLHKSASKGDESCAVASHVLLFPKPEDCKAIVYNRKLDEDSKPKKVGGSLVVLYLESPVQLPKQKSPTQQLCFALPCDKKLGVPTPPSLVDGSSSSDPTQAWGKLLQGSLGGKLAQVLGDKQDFQSYQAPNTSTTTAGMPFVSCYLGVNDGVLYPLEEGLLFYKPPKFLPRSNLHSIACGRGGGGGDSSSRYVDMVVQCSKDNDTETVEFTNIQREENTVLNSYIHDVLVPAMTKDASGNKKGDDSSTEDSDQVVAEAMAEDDETEDENTEEQDDSDDDDSDEDFYDYAPNEGSDNEAGDSSDDDDEDDNYGSDDEGVAVVDDDFAQELVKEKRRKRAECSDTESEDEDSSGKPRFSKRLRK